MGKLDLTYFQFLSRDELKVLELVEKLMKTHEVVSAEEIAACIYGSTSNSLKELCKARLLCYETGRKYNGYRLTNLGFDYLALKTLVKKNVITGFGSQIGVGKESNIYLVTNEETEEDDAEFCLKLHRLGRTCFRNVKNKRDYIPNNQKNKSNSWLSLSKKSAAKEYQYMNALYRYNFPIPKPIGMNRHCVVMEYIKGSPLQNVRQLSINTIENLYDQLMELIVLFARHGCIHGDFNEFNIMIRQKDESPIIIDFPQMVSMDHPNAEQLFTRDVQCIQKFFSNRFAFESELYPTFDKVKKLKKIARVDNEIYTPGFKRKDFRDFDRYIKIDMGLGDNKYDNDDDIVREEMSGSKNDSQDESQGGSSADEERTLKVLKNIGVGSSTGHCKDNINGKNISSCSDDDSNSKYESCKSDDEQQSDTSDSKKSKKHSPHIPRYCIDKELNSEKKYRVQDFVNSSVTGQIDDEFTTEDKIRDLNITANDEDISENSEDESIGSDAVSISREKLRIYRIESAMKRCKKEFGKQALKKRSMKEAAKNARSQVVYQGRKENKAVVSDCKNCKDWF